MSPGRLASIGLYWIEWDAQRRPKRGMSDRRSWFIRIRIGKRECGGGKRKLGDGAQIRTERRGRCLRRQRRARDQGHEGEGEEPVHSRRADDRGTDIRAPWRYRLRGR